MEWREIDLRHAAGIVGSTLLLGLGAPFWFNMLRSLASLRPAVARNLAKEAEEGGDGGGVARPETEGPSLARRVADSAGATGLFPSRTGSGSCCAGGCRRACGFFKLPARGSCRADFVVARRFRATAVAAWFLALAGAWAAEPDPMGILVEGKGVRIERRELESEVQRLRGEAMQRGKPIPDEQLPEIRRQVLERLAVVRLCEARATPADRAKAADSAGKFIDGLRQSQGAEGLARLLRQAGYTEAAFHGAKTAEAIVTAVIDREVRAVVRIPSADVREYYEKHAEQWEQPAAVRVQSLLISLRTSDGRPLGADAMEIGRAHV